MCIVNPSSDAAQQILDRVLVSFDNTTITLSDVEKAYRFELLLEGKTTADPPDRATIEQVSEHLADQRLLATEADASTDDPEADTDAALQELDEVRKKFPSEDAFQAALRELGLDEQRLLDRLAEQQRILRTVDERLRPAATPSDSEVEAYYRETFVKEFARRKGGAPPPLVDVENQIREILIQKTINQLLANWLQELKSEHRVIFHAF
jgi:hypothetical protein